MSDEVQTLHKKPIFERCFPQGDYECLGDVFMEIALWLKEKALTDVHVVTVSSDDCDVYVTVYYSDECGYPEEDETPSDRRYVRVKGYAGGFWRMAFVKGELSEQWRKATRRTFFCADHPEVDANQWGCPQCLLEALTGKASSACS